MTMRILGLLSALALIACGGSSTTCGAGTTLVNNVCTVGGSTALTCGAGTIATNGTCVVDASGCAAGTVLNSAGVCEPAPTCAEGSTFDVGTKQCVADIKNCGANTKVVDGACKAVVRVSLSMQDATVTEPLDWYALSLEEYWNSVLDTFGDVTGMQPVFLGSTSGPFAGTALAEVDVSFDEPQVLIFVTAGQPFAIEVGHVSDNVFSPPLDAPAFDGEWTPSSPTVPPKGFRFVPGDNVLVYLEAGTHPFAAHLVLPDGEPEADKALVSFAVFNEAEEYTFGLVDQVTHVEDPMAVSPFVRGFARTRPVSLPATDAPIPVHYAVNHGGLGGGAGSTAGVIAGQADSPAHELVAGQRYVCVVGGVASVICFDGLAHAPATDTPATLPDSYKRRGFLPDDVPTRVHRRVLNVFGSTVVIKQKSASTGGVVHYRTSTAMTHYFLGGTLLDFALFDGSNILLTEPRVAVPDDSTERSFLLVAPDPNEPAKPTLTMVDELTTTGVAQTAYTIINATASAHGASVYTSVPPTKPTLDPGKYSQSKLASSCPVTHYFRVEDSCYQFSPCTAGVNGHHAVIAILAAAPLLYDEDGTAYGLTGGGPCP